MNQSQPHTANCITGNASNLQLYQDSETVQLKAFYHGRSVTHKEAVDDSLELMNMHSRQGLDFDPTGSGGIYFAHVYDVSRKWAIRQAIQCRENCLKQMSLSSPWVIPVVYSYDVPDEKLEQLDKKTWDTVRTDGKIGFRSKAEEDDWKKFVLRSRCNQNQDRHDMVTGPMMSNPIDVLVTVRKQTNSEGFNLDNIATAEVQWNEKADQTAIYSNQAKILFQQHRNGRDIISFEDPSFDKFEKIHMQIKRMQNRAQISRFRLNNPALEESSVMQKYVDSLKKSMINHFLTVLAPLKEHKTMLADCLKKYGALGDLEDTGFSMQILEIEREFQENQEYKERPDFEEYLMKAADLRCLAGLLNYNAADLITNLQMPFLNEAFIYANKDFTTAYQIAKIIATYQVEYMPELSHVSLGAPLGSGRKKDAYRLPDGTVMVKMKSFDFFHALSCEIGMLDFLKNQGLPVVNILGITLHNHMPAMIMPYMPEQSKDFKAELATSSESASASGSVQKISDKIVRLPQYMTRETLKQLVRIQRQLQAQRILVSDLQFLIGDGGDIVIADPRKVDPDQAPSAGNIGTINHTLAAGIVKELRLIGESVSCDYLWLSEQITNLTDLKDPTQIGNIIDILKKKYQIKVSGQIPEKPKAEVKAPPPQKTPHTRANTSRRPKPPLLVPDANKGKILVALRTSAETKEYDGKPRYFLSIPDSKDATLIQSLFDMTTADFYNAYLVLKGEAKVYSDDSGLYLLES